MSSGLYDQLTSDGLLVTHAEATPPQLDKGVYKVIAPQVVPVVSYPYEWSFSQLKDAALATLRIQKMALEHGMSLRDASAYNIQFVDGKPCLIDTLSFEAYEVGMPWQAYRQFCQHFLAPLALMSTRDLALSGLLQLHLDGLPLTLVASLLPRRSRLRPGLMVHLTMHARLQRQNESTGTGATGAKTKSPSRTVSRTALLGIIDSLERTIKGLRPKATKTEWGQYYQDTNYSDTSFARKKTIVEGFLTRLKPKRVLDLGANNGLFSRLASDQGAYVISCDIDPLAVEINYLEMQAKGETNLLPLLVDLANPSPSIGWANRERKTFTERVGADAVMALALIHHLAIGNNLPFELVAEYFAELGPNLIIEFVPKTDSQVQRLLVGREDIFGDYSEAGFERAFGTYYQTVDKVTLKSPNRTLYLMRRR
jgi:SAM-dependent methyltransferase